MNPPIPILPCFNCKKLTTATQSIYGVGCMQCFLNTNATFKNEKSFGINNQGSVSERETSVSIKL